MSARPTIFELTRAMAVAIAYTAVVAGLLALVGMDLNYGGLTGCVFGGYLLGYTRADAK